MSHIKISDLIVKRLVALGLEDVFCVTGGASAHLLESIRVSGINVVHNYSEQACAMAADAYARVKKKPALVLVTNGPGVSNTITGVLGAFQDSIPMIILSGQVHSKHSIDSNNLELRQLGIQELATSKLVSSVVKNFIQVSNVTNICKLVDDSWDIATSGRPGPVWIEVPLNFQSENSIWDEVYTTSKNYSDIEESKKLEFKEINSKILNKLKQSHRPLLVIGHGVRLSNAENELKQAIELLGIPVVSTWNASDLFEYSNPQYIGNFGILGQRASNMAVQNADMILILGSRLSIPSIGHSTELFSPNSYKIMVDIDQSELNKPTLNINLKICSDLKYFLDQFNSYFKNDLYNFRSRFNYWTDLLQRWKIRFSEKDKDKSSELDRINAYEFIEILSSNLPKNSIVVTDMGMSFTCTMQNFKNNGFNRLFTSSGTSSMGFGLPGSIGAHVASAKETVICITGDGGLQMNIQEIQTLIQYKIPVKIFILDSNGYLAISVMQDHLFGGKHFGSSPESGVSAPNFVQIFEAYGVKSHRVKDVSHLLKLLQNGELESRECTMFHISLPNSQVMSPRVKSIKSAEGGITSSSIDKMWPFLSEDENFELSRELTKLRVIQDTNDTIQVREGSYE